ncbi:MAG: flagellar hook-basal body complex protein FliE [Pseudomonadota bacterium]|nr:flagellar hook-basal body complex protein FliE [Pseudomonadota bacterium]
MAGPVEMSGLLAQMQELRSIASREPGAGQKIDIPNQSQPQFSSMFKDALDQVAELQSQAGNLQEAYVRGDNVDITRVMVASQKSSIAFQAVVQVRNKLVESYKDIMNMPV